MCEILGYSPEELKGLSLRDITHPDDLTSSLENLRKMESGQIDTFSLEKRYIRKDGTVIWVRSNVAQIQDSETQDLYEIAIIEDISQ